MKHRPDLGMYEKPYPELDSMLRRNRIDFYTNPSKVYIEPFPIAGNLYYVGDTRVCAHLIDTGDGLILFDAGFQHTIHLLVQSIWEAGFNPRDIKYLILSHGHFDHFGACNEFRSLYGCETLLSKVDCQVLRKTPEAGLLDMNPNPYATLPVIDRELEDGDVITLGNTSINCVLSPGHSPGTMSFFFDIQEKGDTYTVGYFGGTGFLTLYKEFLEQYHLDLKLRDAFKETIVKLKNFHVDICLGNHPSQNATLEKRRKMQECPEINPFIDHQEWGSYLERLARQYEAFLEQGF